MAEVNNSSANNVDALDSMPERRDKEYSNFFLYRTPTEPLYSGFNYVFFTAPELSLTASRFNGGTGNGTVLMGNNGNFLKLPGYGDSIYTEDMVSMLAGERGTFMSLFTNRAASIPASDLVLDSLEYSETWNKYKIPIGSTKKDTQIAPNFEIQFQEDSKLSILKSIRLWTEYIQGLFTGDVVSSYAARGSLSDTQNSIIDYMCSIYVFSLRPDGKTIQYWAKYTGVYPTKESYSIFQSEDSNINVIQKVPVEFQAAYKEDMHISILRDFNLVGKQKTIDNTGIYFEGNRTVLTEGNTSGPHIVKVTDGAGGVHYELRITDNSALSGTKTNF